MKNQTEGERKALIDLIKALSPVSGINGARPTIKAPDISPKLEWLIGKRLEAKPRAALFDIYGTLISSGAGSLHEQSRRKSIPASEQAGRRMIPEREFATLSGQENPDCPRELSSLQGLLRELPMAVAKARAFLEVERSHPEIVIERVLQARFPGLGRATAMRLVIGFETLANPCAPMPGALGTLEKLRAAGIKLGIVSNAQFYTPLYLEAFFGAPPKTLGFEEELSFFSFEIGHAKPGKKLFELAISALLALGIGPNDTAVIGNSYPNDIRFPAERGFRTVLFAGDELSFRPGALEAEASREGVPPAAPIELEDEDFPDRASPSEPCVLPQPTSIIQRLCDLEYVFRIQE